VQLLYPWTRRQLIVSAFAAYTFDVVGVFALLFATLLICNTALGWQLRIPSIAIAAVNFVALSVLLVTGGLWLLTLRHRLLASFLGLVGLMLICCGYFFAYWALRIGVGVGFIILGYAGIVTLLGIAAWRRWMRAEWGMLGP
jgi:hypothetical protein